MISTKYLLSLLIILFSISSCISNLEPYFLREADAASKPWTRWWWMGNSVTEEGITRHLEAFSEKGFGGVEIVPIYGEKGDEENFIPYLSKKWVERLVLTLEEAGRLGLQVDIALGSGWPLGGPWVTENYAARKYGPGSGATGVPTHQLVKRAAPGGEGLVVDHFNPEAMSIYLLRFDSLIGYLNERNLPIRAVFNDSYEVYGANWTSDFPEQFKNRRGYDLLSVYPSLFDSLESEEEGKGWSDYHRTIHDLLLETTGMGIRKWCESKDIQYRYQAHGSPGNLLDLYASADIPETESFGSSRFHIPGVSYDPDYEVERFALPDPLIMKFASSPAHILNKNLVSAETGTWLGNHFKVSLSQVKPQIDELFLAGINHIFYHGIAYSPIEKPFPGRLFYAATNFGPSSALWPYMGELNDYVANCQSILQHTESANDLLIYYPQADRWFRKGSPSYILPQDIHNPENWLYDTPFGETIKSLWEKGFAFDYVSDLQLDHITKGKIVLPDHYRVLLVPETSVIPLQTLRNLLALSSEKLKVLFTNSYPSQVSGHYYHTQRLDTLRLILDGLKNSPIKKVDQKNMVEELILLGVVQFDPGADDIRAIRKKHKRGDIYFISNLGGINLDQDLFLPGESESVELYDPETGIRGFVPVRKNEDGAMVRLQLPPGKSLFLITYRGRVKGEKWDYVNPATEGLVLDSGWELHFSDSLKIFIDSLCSWTRLSYSWAPFYSGEAVYQTRFSAGQKFRDYDRFILDLGEVREMASVSINQQFVGKVWHVPFQLELPSSILKTENTLSIQVMNLDANRVIQLDQAEFPWKNFYDINFVDITYQPFDASGWDPLLSGLIGPVRLISCKN